MLRVQRLTQILEILEKTGAVEVSALSEIFKVSEVTIRRDLQSLEERGILRRSHGGAVLAHAALVEQPVAVRLDYEVKGKKKIATAAARLISDGSTILLDSGTTTFALARQLNAFRGLTVITNAINIAAELVSKPGVTVLMVGGLVRSASFSCVGPEAEETLGQFRVHQTFLGMGGASLDAGLTNRSVQEVSIKRAMIKAADQVILLVDSSKIGQVVFARVAPISAVDLIITDDGISAEQLEAFREKGVEILVASDAASQAVPILAANALHRAGWEIGD
jgi:DeoR/GlpR family transcriptional regulator of sugar metabolism